MTDYPPGRTHQLVSYSQVHYRLQSYYSVTTVNHAVARLVGTQSYRLTQNLVLYDRLELPSTDYKTVILPRELIEHKLGTVNGNRTRLNLIDSQVHSPECDHGIKII